MHLLLRFDGSCVGNGSLTATGGYGWRIEVVRASGGGLIAEGHGVVGSSAASPVTNNVAEWRGLIAGLEWLRCARDIGRPNLVIQGDSQLVIRQLTGRYGFRKPHLKTLCEAAWEILNDMADTGTMSGWEANWIPRDENDAADELSTRGGRLLHRERATR